MARHDQIKVGGGHSLHDLQNAIRRKETQFWKFRELQVVHGKNIATFDPWDGLAPGISLQTSDDPPPAGMEEEWRGRVCCEGSELEAVLYRA